MVEMAPRQQADLKVGDIIDKTAAVVSANLVPAVVFLVVFTALGTATDLFLLRMQEQLLVAGTTPDMGSAMQVQMQTSLISIAVAIATIVGVYLLLRTMLERLGQLSGGGHHRFLAFIGLSIVSGIGTALGLILLIIPGLIIMARWSIAPSMLLVEGKGVFATLGESWAKTKGHEFPIILAAVAMLILFYAIAFLPALVLSDLGTLAAVVSRIGSTAATVVSTGLGVALFTMLAGKTNLAGTFE